VLRFGKLPDTKARNWKKWVDLSLFFRCFPDSRDLDFYMPLQWINFQRILEV